MTSEMPSKDELERQKLQLEIELLARPWWRHPAYIGLYSAIALAVVTVAPTLLRGYFNSERRHLIEDLSLYRSRLDDIARILREAEAQEKADEPKLRQLEEDTKRVEDEVKRMQDEEKLSAPTASATP